MAWYKAGTIAVTNGSKVVTGSGTAFIASVRNGFILSAPDDRVYEIDGIQSDSQFTLAAPYKGATAAEQGYSIAPTQGVIADLSEKAAELVGSFGSVRDAFPGIKQDITAAQTTASSGVTKAGAAQAAANAAQSTANAALPKASGSAYNLSLSGVLQSTDTFYAANQYAYRLVYGNTWGPEVLARWDGATVNRWMQWGYRNNSQAYTTIMMMDTNNPGIIISPNAARVRGDSMFEVHNTLAVVPATQSGIGGANQSASCLYVGGSGGRSINAAMAINASGLDYAEYMTKSGDFVLEKGGVTGINAAGKLTNKFAEAVTFLVKSTDPAYVGGDTWGNADIVGTPPLPIFRMEGVEATTDTPATAPETDAEWGIRQTQYDKAVVAYQGRMEEVRKNVDRMAFCGQVPVNVLGAKAGDYIVPVADGAGIKGIAVRYPNIDQYMIAVGKVIAIESDGRARIIVKTV